MLLGYHDCARFTRGADNGIAIERLDGIHVDHTRRNPLIVERFLRPQRLSDEQPVSDDGDVAAAVILSAVELKGSADGETSSGRMHDRRLRASGAEKDRADVSRCSVYQCTRRDLVSR